MPPAPGDLRERLMEKVTVLESGCWEWTGTTNGNGYGRLWDNAKGEKDYAHRISYELEHGPIPAGLEIDHLCRNRSCVNPDHLEAVTRKINQNRGESVSGKNHRKTHCPKGHPYDEENTYWHMDGKGRQCKTCRAEYRTAHRDEMREYRREWVRANPEKVREYKRRYLAKQ